MHVRALGPSLAALALAACAGTRDPREPGELLGTFQVTGRLLATSCGPAADPAFSFDARLSREGSTLYWVQGGKAVAISGPIAADASVRMSAEVDAVVARADPKVGAPGCTMRRTDTLSATLRGEPPTAFEGVLVYGFAARAGDCSTELVGAGGPYAKLPCTMTYEIAGARRQ